MLLRLHRAAVQLWSSHVTSLNFRPKSEVRKAKENCLQGRGLLWNHHLPETQPSCKNGTHMAQLEVQEAPESFRQLWIQGLAQCLQELSPAFSAFFCIGSPHRQPLEWGCGWG